MRPQDPLCAVAAAMTSWSGVDSTLQARSQRLRESLALYIRFNWMWVVKRGRQWFKKRALEPKVWYARLCDMEAPMDELGMLFLSEMLNIPISFVCANQTKVMLSEDCERGTMQGIVMMMVQTPDQGITYRLLSCIPGGVNDKSMFRVSTEVSLPTTAAQESTVQLVVPVPVPQPTQDVTTPRKTFSRRRAAAAAGAPGQEARDADDAPALPGAPGSPAVKPPKKKTYSWLRAAAAARTRSADDAPPQTGPVDLRQAETKAQETPSTPTTAPPSSAQVEEEEPAAHTQEEMSIAGTLIALCEREYPEETKLAKRLAQQEQEATRSPSSVPLKTFLTKPVIRKSKRRGSVVSRPQKIKRLGEAVEGEMVQPVIVPAPDAARSSPPPMHPILASALAEDFPLEDAAAPVLSPRAPTKTRKGLRSTSKATSAFVEGEMRQPGIVPASEATPSSPQKMHPILASALGEDVPVEHTSAPARKPRAPTKTRMGLRSTSKAKSSSLSSAKEAPSRPRRAAAAAGGPKQVATDAEASPSGSRGPRTSAKTSAPKPTHVGRRRRKRDEALVPCKEPSCPAVFLNESAMKRHHCQKHPGEGTLQCDQCDVRVANRSNLLKHKAVFHPTSEDKAKHVCPECRWGPTQRLWKHFPNASALKMHMKSHTSQKLQCPSCPATFKYEHDLKRHKTAKHSGLEFKCKECGYVAKSDRALLTHTIGHHGEGYKCEHCGQTFTHHETRHRHIQKVHPDKM